MADGEHIGEVHGLTHGDVPIPAKPLPRYLRTRQAGWRATDYAENESWYRSLAKQGQRPRAMLVCCCDSRVDIGNMFGAEPGDLFVVRNVANLVPPHAPDGQHHGTSAAVEYAVKALGVAHIVVTGHSDCGGVKACHEMCMGGQDAPATAQDDSYISRWIDILRPGFARVANRVAATDRLRALEHEAVLTSLRNLMTFPFVAEAVALGALTLHGTYLDIGTGMLLVYDPRTDDFA
ncbi:MAG: carbonic anhydrase [Pseudomonadota bacterium]